MCHRLCFSVWFVFRYVCFLHLYVFLFFLTIILFKIHLSICITWFNIGLISFYLPLLELASVFLSISPSPSFLMNDSDVSLPEASGKTCETHLSDSNLNENVWGIHQLHGVYYIYLFWHVFVLVLLLFKITQTMNKDLLLFIRRPVLSKIGSLLCTKIVQNKMRFS